MDDVRESNLFPEWDATFHLAYRIAKPLAHALHIVGVKASLDSCPYYSVTMDMVHDGDRYEVYVSVMRDDTLGDWVWMVSAWKEAVYRCSHRTCGIGDVGTLAALMASAYVPVVGKRAG